MYFRFWYNTAFFLHYSFIYLLSFDSGIVSRLSSHGADLTSVDNYQQGQSICWKLTIKLEHQRPKILWIFDFQQICTFVYEIK